MTQPSDNVAVVRADMLGKLRLLADELGISLSGDGRLAPTIDAGNEVPVRKLALELGKLAARQDLFLNAGQLTTVNFLTGEELPMQGARFVGWIEDFTAIKGARQASLSRGQAELVLEQDIFRQAFGR